MITLHEVTDGEKVERIAASIEANGWQGAPLVKWGDVLITGVHRYAAAQELELRDSEIPSIELDEVFAEAGMDIAVAHEEWGCPTYAEGMFVEFIRELPETVREKYGIDLQ